MGLVEAVERTLKNIENGLEEVKPFYWEDVTMKDDYLKFVKCSHPNY